MIGLDRPDRGAVRHNSSARAVGLRLLAGLAVAASILLVAAIIAFVMSAALGVSIPDG